MLTWWSLFRFAQIRSIDTFQDGGLRHNNLINLALWESRYIWPAIDKPDIVLSLDTGVEKKALFSHAPNFRNLIQDEFISRLKRSFISLLTDQDSWRELWNRLDDRATSANSETANKINFGETSEFGEFGGKSADSAKNQRIQRHIKVFFENQNSKSSS
jgi:hypothetical protein